MKKILLIATFIILFCFFIYYHPTKEFVKCNQDYKCNVQREYFKFIKNTRTFYLNKSSSLGTREKLVVLRHTYYDCYILFDNYSPFIYYWNHSSSSENYNNYYFNIENEKFNNYLKNSKNEYYVESEASKSALFYYSLFIIIFIFNLLPIYFKIQK